MTPVRSVGGRVRGVMMGRAGRPLDDGVAGAGRAVVAAVLTAMMPTRVDGLEVLGLVAAAGAATQIVRTAAGATQEVRPGGTAAPLQFLQLGTVVLRAAGHASAGDQLLLGHTCRTASERAIAISAKSSIRRHTNESPESSIRLSFIGQTHHVRCMSPIGKIFIWEISVKKGKEREGKLYIIELTESKKLNLIHIFLSNEIAWNRM